MKFFSKKYNERAQRIERYILKNKLFLIIATVLVVFLIGNSLKPDTQKLPEETVTETEEVNTESADEPLHWRFYSIDLWILFIGGGFCSLMIVKERRKAKEKLN